MADVRQEDFVALASGRAGALVAKRLLLIVAIVVGVAMASYANWNMLVSGGAPSIQGGDDTGYYVWLRSAVIDGDLDFANDFAAARTLTDDSREQWLDAPRTAAGRLPDKFAPGWAMVMAPGFLAGHAWAKASGAPADGWSPPYFVGLWLWHSVLAVLGLWWAWRVACRYAAETTAAIAVLAVWLASPLVYYHTGRAGMVHGILFSLLAGATYFTCLIREEKDHWWHWSILGLVATLAVATREPTILYLVFSGVVIFRRWRAMSTKHAVGCAVAAGVPALVVVGVACAARIAVDGTLFAPRYPGEAFDFLHPHLVAVLFSPKHGLFYWHPLLLIGACALAVGVARRALPVSWAISTVAVWYVNASWWSWWFGSSFGNRGFEGAILFAMVAIGWGLDRLPRTAIMRALSTAVVGAGVAFGIVSLVLYVTKSISREEAVTYREMWSAIWDRSAPVEPRAASPGAKHDI